MVNRARYFHHCKHSVTSKWCGKFEQMDGNQKVKRSRCSAVLDLPVAYGEPLTSGEHLYYSKFCPETPVRDDPDGYCKVGLSCCCCVLHGLLSYHPVLCVSSSMSVLANMHSGHVCAYLQACHTHSMPACGRPRTVQ